MFHSRNIYILIKQDPNHNRSINNLKFYNKYMSELLKKNQGDTGEVELKINDPFEFKNEKQSGYKNYEALCRGDEEDIEYVAIKVI